MHRNREQALLSRLRPFSVRLQYRPSREDCPIMSLTLYEWEGGGKDEG